MTNKLVGILKSQSGMQVLEAIGLAIFALIAVALIFNATRGGVGGVASKVGNIIGKVNNNL